MSGKNASRAEHRRRGWPLGKKLCRAELLRRGWLPELVDPSAWHQGRAAPGLSTMPAGRGAVQRRRQVAIAGPPSWLRGDKGAFGSYSASPVVATAARVSLPRSISW